MSENKSGFEIRADLLGQAQGILEQNLHRKADAVHVHNDNYPNNKQPLPAEIITASDIINVAKELNEFVNQK
jgi:hypothetical protein